MEPVLLVGKDPKVRIPPDQGAAVSVYGGGVAQASLRTRPAAPRGARGPLVGSASSPGGRCPAARYGAYVLGRRPLGAPRTWQA